MNPADAILPLVLLLGLGFGLVRVKLAAPQTSSDISRLVYYVFLPALVIDNLLGQSLQLDAALGVLRLFVVATAVAALAAIPVGWAFRMTAPQIATICQAAFRGNLAFIAIPVLQYAEPEAAARLLPVATLAFPPCMILYNMTAVGGFAMAQKGKVRWSEAIAAMATNPLIIAALVGFLLCGIHWTPPLFVSRAIHLLGLCASPLALLCVGGSLARQFPRTHIAALASAAGLKLLLLPAVMFLLIKWLNIDSDAALIGMVFSATPTAAASYVTAREMGGDDVLAAGAVALSTVLSIPVLFVVVGIFG